MPASTDWRILPFLIWLFASVPLALGQNTEQAPFRPDIPRTWVDEEIESLDVPLVKPEFSPVHVSAEYFYAMEVRPIYLSYPAYLPGRAPEGYMNSLLQKEPEIIFDAASLKTEEDWIRAGETVFDAPTTFVPYSDETAQFLFYRWLDRMKLPELVDGIVPYFRYVVREKGKLEIAWISCMQCHTRVMPDGRVIKGAQGNFFDPALGFGATVERSRLVHRSLFKTPWIDPDPIDILGSMELDEIYEVHAAIPRGVIARHRTSPFAPVQVPDLIGVKDRKYLDRTGLQQHRGIVDMMRYAAMNTGADGLASFGGFVPNATGEGNRPDPATQARFSDEQLYALSLYIYSLEPPDNPNPFDEKAARGQEVFRRQGCDGCHTPPFYTNNKLTPATGFEVPQEHRAKYDILDVSVGTDPSLTLETRRGTGYYKVPSLKGVWYRGPFEHSGSVATLEDWFDPARLRDDYKPTGFTGYGVEARAVQGHEFGLHLSAEDKAALIAFLKTL